MKAIKIQSQGSANQYALLKGSNTLGEVLGNGELLEEQHLQLAVFAVNLLEGRFPIAPSNARWEALSLDEPNRLTLVSYTNNQPNWLLVLTAHRPIAIPGPGVCHAS